MKAKRVTMPRKRKRKRRKCFDSMETKQRAERGNGKEGDAEMETILISLTLIQLILSI